MPPGRLLIAGLLAGTATVAMAADPPTFNVEPSRGWRYSVYAADLPNVDNLALASDGTLYVTLEQRAGSAAVVRLGKDKRESILGDLNRADGLLLRGKRLYVTEEVSEGRVIEINLAQKTHRVLATLDKAEGIGMLPNGDLVVTEDTVQGRLLRLHKDGSVEVLLSGLNRPEGLAVAADGSIYIAETSTGRILQFKNGRLNTVVNDLNEPDQIRFAPDGALWITEDASPGQLLRLKDGNLETVASGLSYPQGIVFFQDGVALVAEQGRGRILRFVAEPPATPKYVPPP